MSVPQVLDLCRDLFYTALLLAMPTLAVGLIVGVLISVFQAVTSIQEQTLSYVPRIVAVAIVLLLTLSWALQTAIHFTLRMLWHASEVTR